jgi:hypothetical protein
MWRKAGAGTAAAALLATGLIWQLGERPAPARVRTPEPAASVTAITPVPPAHAIERTAREAASEVIEEADATEEAAAVEDAGIADDSPQAVVEEVVELGYAFGEGADAEWRDYVERLREDAAASTERLVGALQALPAEDRWGPAERALLLALGDAGDRSAVEPLHAVIEGPLPEDRAEDAILTRSMAMESLAKVALRSGGFRDFARFREAMEEQIADPDADVRLGATAARMLLATSARPDDDRARIAVLLGPARAVLFGLLPSDDD